MRLRGMMRDESEGEESEPGETRRGKRKDGVSVVVWVEMENLPTELFLARILRPAVCQNEEGNIISLPSGSFSPVTTLTSRPVSSLRPRSRPHPHSRSRPRPIVPFLVNREFEL